MQLPKQPHGAAGREVLLGPPSEASTAATEGAAPAPSDGRQRASPLLFLAVIVACMSPLLFGFSLAFTSPTQPTMEGDKAGDVLPPSDLVAFTLSTEKWYASLFNIGAVIGAFSGSAMSDRFGRKNTIAFTALPHVAAWVGTALTRDWRALTALRVLCGWAVGIGSAVTPCYIGEISTTGLRGALGAANQLSVTIGIFLVSLLGNYAFVERYEGETFSEWRALAWFGAVIALVLLLTLCMPESPQWLAKRGDAEGARAALSRLRAGDSSLEAEGMLAEASPPPSSASGAAREEGFNSGGSAGHPGAGLGAYSRSLVVGVGLCCFQQLSGVNAIMMYTTKICQQAHMQDAELSAMASMAAQVVLTALSCVLIERAGRRPLLLFASSSMALSHLVLSYYYVAQAYGWWGPSWVALMALGLFIVGFSLGLGPIPWLILAELFPTQVRGSASSLATAVNWCTSFVVCLSFQPLQDAITPQGTFFLFAMICSVCFIFVKLRVPETKGKTVDMVLLELRSARAGVRDVALAPVLR